MKTKDLRSLKAEELKEKLSTFQQQLFKLSQQRYSGRVEKPHLFKQLRKDIARIKTVLRELTLKKQSE